MTESTTTALPSTDIPAPAELSRNGRHTPAPGGWKGANPKAKPADLVTLAGVLRDAYGAMDEHSRRDSIRGVETVLFDPPALAAVLAIVAAGSGTHPDYEASKTLALRQLAR